MQPAHVLAALFVTVNFHWDSQRLSQLELVLSTFESFPTKTDICVFSDDTTALATVFKSWHFHGVEICGYPNDNDTNPYAVVWQHRHAVELALTSGLYTAFINVEADFKLTWTSLLSWAVDTAVLDPMGFQRGFFATEFHPDSGRLMEVGNQPVLLASHLKTLHLNVTNQHNPARPISALCYENDHFKPASDVRWPDVPRCPHACFLQLPNPYTGFWVATALQLQRWVDSNQWKKAEALANTSPTLEWGYAETAAASMQLVRIPSGFDSASVVPFDCEIQQLKSIAGVAHLPNKYAARKQLPFGTCTVADLLQ